MSATVNIASAAQFRTLLSTSNIVVTDFYADWCGPCKAIAPVYEQLSSKYSKPKAVTFTKVNVDNQQQIAQQYGVSAMPTFLIFRGGSVVNTIRGADPRGLTAAVENAVKLSPAAAKPTFSTPGRTLGGPSARPRTSLNRPLSATLYSWYQAIFTFLGLYFTSLFSLDPYTAAENSSFNIHRVTPPKTSGSVKIGGKAAAAPPTGRRMGTLADITGGS